MSKKLLRIDKKKLIEQLIEKINAGIENQRKSFESAKRSSIESPGRMQSRYDSTGVESSWVANGLAKSLSEKASYVSRLEKFIFRNSHDKVLLGNIVGIRSIDSNNLDYFFMVPAASGYKLQEQGISITTLTAETPLGKALIGKEVGDEIEIRFPKPHCITIEELI